MSKRHPLPTRLIILLAQNPDMELTIAEIAHKFGVSRRHAGATLRYSVRNGWFEKVLRDGKVMYVTGPTLKEEL